MASNYVGELIHAARIDRSMTFGDLARACGATTAKQTSRIAHRLVLFEREGVRDRRLLQKVIAALDLDPAVVVELLDRQHVEELEEWNRWADEPVEIELHVVPFGGFAFRYQLPEGSDDLTAFRLAKELTRGREQMRAVVAVSRRLSFVFERGVLTQRIEAAPGRSVPVMQIGHSLVRFDAVD